VASVYQYPATLSASSQNELERGRMTERLRLWLRPLLWVCTGTLVHYEHIARLSRTGNEWQRP
jgi:hypothetical protein